MHHGAQYALVVHNAFWWSTRWLCTVAEVHNVGLTSQVRQADRQQLYQLADHAKDLFGILGSSLILVREDITYLLLYERHLKVLLTLFTFCELLYPLKNLVTTRGHLL